MSALTSGLKAVLPAPVIRQLKSLIAGVKLASLNSYDSTRFRRHSAAVSSRTIEQQDAEITKMYHAIEKGLALAAPRPGFGAIVVSRLCGMIVQRIECGEPWTRPCANSINALTAYREHAVRHGAKLPDGVGRVLTLVADRGLSVDGSATRVVRRSDIDAAIAFDAPKFFWSRHSIRQYAPGVLDAGVLASAIDMARSAPSVCNRQSGRVHVITDDATKRSALRFQNGNRGFGDTAQAILIVTADLNSFVDPTERYQAWIDGGMFSMALILALHASRLGTCCLNWSSSKEADIGLRRAAQIPDHETVIMLIAVGKLPDTIVVANSERIPLTDVMRIYP